DPGAGTSSGTTPGRDHQPTAAARFPRACAARPSTAPYRHPLRLAPGEYPLTISQERAFIQLFQLRTWVVFKFARSATDRSWAGSLRVCAPAIALNIRD